MREYSNSVIDKIWILLNKTFKIAISRRLIIWNPMEDITINKPVSKKISKIIEALTIDEESKLIQIFKTQEKSHKYRNIILLQLSTGMRIGEVLALSLNDIDFNNKVIHINKSFTRDENEKMIVGEHTKTYSRRANIDRGKRDFPITSTIDKILKDILSNNISNMKQMLFWIIKIITLSFL